MKMKVLRRKHEKPEYREFASLENGEFYTHQHPSPLGDDATIEGLKSICTDEVDWDKYEVVEIEYFEKGELGADIRNKLSPPKNLVNLLEVYFDNPETVDLDKLRQIIRREMNQTKISVEYLAKLL